MKRRTVLKGLVGFLLVPFLPKIEVPVIYQDTIEIDQERKIKKARELHADWFAEQLDREIFEALSGPKVKFDAVNYGTLAFKSKEGGL